MQIMQRTSSCCGYRFIVYSLDCNHGNAGDDTVPNCKSSGKVSLAQQVFFLRVCFVDDAVPNTRLSGKESLTVLVLLTMPYQITRSG